MDNYKSMFGWRASLIAAAIAAMPLSAQAAGLGKLTVLSALGQPLRAELELSASREELSGLSAKVAPPSAYLKAGVEYNAAVTDIRTVIERRGKHPVVRLTSHRPLNDPFLTVLVELNWPSGRMMREYTFLLDPPEVAAKREQVFTPASAGGSQVARLRNQAPIDSRLLGADGTYKVQRGDTLNKIAMANAPEGVSLDQMLVALYQQNPKAFINGNMNQLRAGRILQLPDVSTASAITQQEARRVVKAHASDWNSYRRKLAAAADAAPARSEGSDQVSAGQIGTKVDAVADEAAGDRLALSKAASAGTAVSLAGEEDRLATSRALQEANDRLAELERNVRDLQRLLELKNAELAAIQGRAGSGEVQPAPVQPTPIKPIDGQAAAPKAPAEVPPAPAAEVKPEAKPAEPKPDETKPEAKVEPAVAPAAPPAEVKAEVKPEPKPEATPKKRRPKPLPPPPPEPDFVDMLLEDPLPLAAGGGALLALGLGYVAWRRRKQAAEGDGMSQEPLSVAPTSSVFGSTGGQSVDTAASSSLQTDFSQAGPGTIDADEVDPVAEADVYMAYGRDAQAEEILLEALQKDPQRHAIHLKLLEIYANRRNTKQYETLATELYSATTGKGADWEKAAAMGVKLDPENPLYRGGVAGMAASGVLAGDAPAAEETVILAPAKEGHDTVTMPGALAQAAEQADSENGPAEDDALSLDFDLGDNASEEETAAESSDFDLDLGEEEAPAEENGFDADATMIVRPEEMAAADVSEAESAAPDEKTLADSAEPVDGLDFDLGMTDEPQKEVVETAPAPQPEDSADDLDFDLGMSDEDLPADSAEEVINLETPESGDDGLDLELDLAGEGTAQEEVPPPGAPAFDFSSIDLELGEGANEVKAEPEGQTAEPDGADSEEAMPVAADDGFDLDLGEASDEVALGSDEIAAEEPAAESKEAADDASVEGEVTPTETASGAPAAVEEEPEMDDEASQEVETKIELAKAYEEMGDKEGARELLEEALSEGNAGQKAKAQQMLDALG